MRNSESLGWNLFSWQVHPLSIYAQGNAFLFTCHLWMENAVRFTFARMTNRPKERCISGWRNLGSIWPLLPRFRSLHSCFIREMSFWLQATYYKGRNFYRIGELLRLKNKYLWIRHPKTFFEILEIVQSNRNLKFSKIRTFETISRMEDLGRQLRALWVRFWVRFRVWIIVKMNLKAESERTFSNIRSA